MDILSLLPAIPGLLALAGVVYCFIELKAVGAGVSSLGSAVTQISNELKKLSGGK